MQSIPASKRKEKLQEDTTSANVGATSSSGAIPKSYIHPDIQWNILKEFHRRDHFPIILKLIAQQKISAIPR